MTFFTKPFRAALTIMILNTTVMIKNLLSLSALFFIVVLSSCSSDEGEDPIVDAFDDTYFGVSTLSGNDLVGVWSITITDGQVSGTTTYVEGEEAISVNLNGDVKASGAFDLMVDYGDGYTGMIAGLVSSSGSVTGTWNDSDGAAGSISGKPLDNEYQLYNGNYAGDVTNSDFTWQFSVNNGVVEGKFEDQDFAGLIGLEGSTIKVFEVEVLVDNSPLLVTFGIMENGGINGSWENADDMTQSGEVSGSES